MLIDVNVSLGHWPFQKFALDSAAKLTAHLQAEGIDRALVSPVETAFHPDPHEYNIPLFAALAPHPELLPVPVLNPSLPNWEERLAEYTGEHTIRAVKSLPNYHLYTLDDPQVDRFAESLLECGQTLLLQIRLEDERNQYPPLKIEGVPVDSIIELAQRFPRLPIVCLCPYMAEVAPLIEGSANIHIDLAFVETLNTVATLLEQAPADRVLFGSHTPFLYTRAARMKLDHAEIPPASLTAISSGNAQRLFGHIL